MTTGRCIVGVTARESEGGKEQGRVTWVAHEHHQRRVEVDAVLVAPPFVAIALHVEPSPLLIRDEGPEARDAVDQEGHEDHQHQDAPDVGRTLKALEVPSGVNRPYEV